jgi:putative ABC transport system permease protein
MLRAIAWRNLWRNKLRSSIIMAALSIGIIGAVEMDGYMTGLTNQRVDAAIANEVSDIQLHNPGFLLNQETKYLIPHAGEKADKIRKIANVKAVSVRLKGAAMASSANAGAGISINGVVPDDEYRVSDLHDHIIEGTYLSNKQKIPAVIGQKLAQKLNIGISDKIIVTMTDTTGTITNGAFLVVGIYKTSNTDFDKSNVFVTRKDLAKLIGYPTRAGDEIAILLNSSQQTKAVTKKLNTLFSAEVKSHKLIIQSWDQIQPLLKSMVDMMNYFSYLFLIIVLAALTFAIINTMLMSMMERTREIGMLIALGMNKRKIVRMVMLETIFLSIIGALVGLVISILLVDYLSIHGLDLSSFAKGLNSIGYSSTVYFQVNREFYFTTVIVVVLLAIIASIPAMMRALKLQPATAIREED